MLVPATTFLVMLAYEAAKEALLPPLSLWQSHAITIGFVTALATVLTATLISPALGRYIEAVRTNEERQRALDALVEGMPSAALLVDARGRIVVANEHFARERGVHARALLGAALADPARSELLEIALATREPTSRHARVGERHVLRHAVPASTPSGPVATVALVDLDVTPLVTAQAEIERINADLERRVRERTAELERSVSDLESFSYTVAHDLRAPLRAIDGFAQILDEEHGPVLGGEGRRQLGVVRAEAVRLGALIDDLLRLARVSRAPLEPTSVDLTALARRCAARLEATNPGRVVHLDIDTPLVVEADPALLERLLENLLANAWKFTRTRAEGHVRLGRALVDGEDCLYVRDDGVGFDMKYVGRLFTPFQRLHKPAEFEGTGIGLATVSLVARRHGGRAWAESAVEEGTTVWFTLRPREERQP